MQVVMLILGEERVLAAKAAMMYSIKAVAMVACRTWLWPSGGANLLKQKEL